MHRESELAKSFPGLLAVVFSVRYGPQLVSIPTNVIIDYVGINQVATRSFAIQIMKAGGVGNNSYQSNLTADYTPNTSDTLHHFHCMADLIKIENNSGSNILSYWIFGREILA